MRKLLLMLSGVLAALPALAQNFTYEYEGQTLNYRVIDKETKTCEVIQNQEIIGELIIPDVAKYGETEYTVTSIGKGAFLLCKSLRTVSIPNTVLSISSTAFHSCKALTSIELGSSLTSIGSNAFMLCETLTSVTFGNSLTSIGDAAFSCCTSLESIEIPESVSTLPNNAFSSCWNLVSVIIPNSVTSIGNEAFKNCNLSSVTLPEELTTLGVSCFEECPLTEIIIPESVKSIGDNCFKDCPLTGVKFGANIERIGSNAFSTLSQFEVNENLVSLGDKAFGDNLRLLKISRNTPPSIVSANMGYTGNEAYNILVIVPENGDDVYKNDEKWKGFHIVEAAPTKTVYMTGSCPLSEEIATTTQQMPGAVTSLAIVGPLADGDWNIIKRNLVSCYDLDLTGVTNTEIPAEVFVDNKHILLLKLPANLKAIGNKAFFGCNNLTINELPASLETIGVSAFEGCTVFNVKELPASLKSVGASAFANCSRLQLTSLPAIETLGEAAFYNCQRFMELDMSDAKLNVIERGTFANCTKLRNITLPKTLTAIKGGQYGNFYTNPRTAGAFQNTAVNFVSFPEGLTEIGENAFCNTPLISAELPENLPTIVKRAFAECTKMKTVSFPSNITAIGTEAFLNCSGIKSISMPSDVPPTVGDDAFTNVRYRDVVVAIPTLHYRDYLNSLGWGAFTQLSNSILLDYEEVDEHGNSLTMAEDNNNVEVGVVENGAYDEIVNNIIAEAEQAAEDVALDEALYGEEPVENKVEISARVKRARAEARRDAESMVDDKARQAFARLYPGLSMTIGDNSGYRVKIQPQDGVEIDKIELDGKDITNSYIDGMVTLPMLFSNSTLKVYRKAAPSAITDVTAGDETATADVYNMQGIVVLRNATEAQVSRLNPGIYIYKGRKIAIN